MHNDSNDPYGFDKMSSNASQDDYRKKQEAKEHRRKVRQRQRLLLLGVFALAAILLLVGLVMIFKAIFGKESAPKPKPASSSTSASVSESVPLITHPIAPDPSRWELQLVNLQHPLPDGWQMSAPEQLAVVTNEGHYFDLRAADSLKQMVTDCNANVEGGSLSIFSAYRGPDNQNKRHQRQIEIFKGQGKSQEEATALAMRTEPPAGFSEHQIGLAVDFTTAVISEPTMAFAETPEYQWLIQNAHNYGFILRYPSEKEDITGMLAQPYHFRYVGVEDANLIFSSPEVISLEEYLLVPAQTATPPADASAVDSSAASTPPTSSTP